jgi:nanoRNase/pAp phosphatase (c-di-AMP/oligoRNAs hydrolase)
MNCYLFAKRFGGGGHLKAAGFQLNDFHKTVILSD